jgi:NDP-sugar pyrophosphorylase family protein
VHTAFLLAAGFGTRLQPLSLSRPKPLMPMCGIPMLDHALAHVRAHGHTEVLVNAHHLWEQVAAWAEQRGVGLQVELPEILGTGGGLRAAIDRMADSFVIVNADILSDVDLTALQASMPDDGAAMALRPDPDWESIGPVLRDASGTVVRISTVVPSEAGKPGTHFTGVHAMSRSSVMRVPDTGLQCVVRTAYKELVPAGAVGSIVHTGAWVDVGTPEAYLQANLDVLHGRVRAPVDPWAVGTRGPGDSWVGQGAVMEGELTGCVVGAGSTIPAGARLKDCVIWDGCVAPAEDLERAVVYDDGVLQL